MSEHLLYGLIPEGSAFPDRVEELTSRLAEKIGFSNNQLDYTFECLANLDKTIRRLYGPEQRTAEDLLVPLVAYVTEIGRRQVGGRWDMRIADDGKTWEPWIVTPDGKEFEFFTLVYKELCDTPDDSASLAGLVIGSIRASGLDAMVERSPDSAQYSDAAGNPCSYPESLYLRIGIQRSEQHRRKER